jgi:hypothetical protein
MAFHCYRLRWLHESIQNLSQMIGKTISVAAYYIENRLFNIILFSIRTSNKIESINKQSDQLSDQLLEDFLKIVKALEIDTSQLIDGIVS